MTKDNLLPTDMFYLFSFVLFVLLFLLKICCNLFTYSGLKIYIIYPIIKFIRLNSKRTKQFSMTRLLTLGLLLFMVFFYLFISEFSGAVRQLTRGICQKMTLHHLKQRLERTLYLEFLVCTYVTMNLTIYLASILISYQKNCLATRPLLIFFLNIFNIL